MFERNRVDNSLQRSTVPAEITLLSGEILKGKFAISASRSLFDVLNGDSQFLDFESHQGERAMIAKASLKSVQLISVPTSGALKSRLRDTDTFDPHAILGVSPDAGWDEVRRAYFSLSKAYHPDRYAGLELPPEVDEYLAAMVRRINAAYKALEAPHQAAKRVEVDRAKPVFTSPQRF